MTGGNKRSTILKVAFALLSFSYLSDGQNIICSETLENIAAYEGTLNTLIGFPANKINGIKWTNTATTNDIDDVTLVNYDDTVHPSVIGDYAFSYLAGLTIKNATTTAQPGHNLSTAGLYTAECGGSRFGFKLLVVRKDSNCSCRLVGDSKTAQLTINSIYADSTYDPINAIFTLLVDGSYRSSMTPQRMNYDDYTHISTATFTIDDYDKHSTHLCIQTFSEPTQVQDPSVAMNAPTFNRIVSCPSKMKKSEDYPCLLQA